MVHFQNIKPENINFKYAQMNTYKIIMNLDTVKINILLCCITEDADSK